MYALIALDISSKITEKVLLQNFLQDIEKYKNQDEGISHIFASLWLLDLKNGLSSLRKMLDAADQFQISYKMSFLENKPEFIA